MKKLFLTVISISLLLSFSCNKKELEDISTTKQNQIEAEFQKFANKAGITSFNVKATDSEITNFKATLELRNLKFGNELKFDETTITGKKDSYLFLVPIANESNTYHAFEFLKDMTYKKDFIFSYKEDNLGINVTILTPNGVTKVSVSSDGTVNKIETASIADKNKGVWSVTGFCQQEGNEGFAGCYKREVNDFCDGLVGCLALLHWGPHAVIASACSC